MGRNFRFNLIFIIFVGGLLLTGCRSGDHPDGRFNRGSGGDVPKATRTPEAVPVETETVQKGDVAQFYETTATIESESRIVIYPKISEQVKEIFVEEGDHVRAGQLLALLDDEKLALQVRQARVSRDQAKDTFERTKQLYEAQMTSKENYLNAKYAFENSDVALKMAELDLSHAKIKSPIDGIITDRFISVGDLVTLSSQLFVIIDPKALIVEIYLPEKESRLMTTGMKASLYPDALPGRSFPAAIERIQPFVDSKTGTVKMTLKVLSGFESLSVGMFTRVRIKTAEHKGVVVIPKKALLYDNGDYFVYVMNSDDLAEKRSVKIGLSDGEKTEIIDGLQVGERLIVIGQQNLKPNQYVFDTRSTPVRGGSSDRETPTPEPVDSEETDIPSGTK